MQSCKRGQKSNSSEDGGWFFGSFIETYKQIISNSEKRKPTWEALLTRASEATALYAHDQGALQEPVFRIYQRSAGTGTTGSDLTNHSQADKVKEDGSNKTPSEEISAEKKASGSGACAINLTAVSVLKQELRWLEKFKKEILTMSDDKAVREYRHYYETSRKEFFKQLVQKLNLGQLEKSDIDWFAEISRETSEYLDETAYYLNHPQFAMKATAKLGIPIENLRNADARLRDLMRDCRGK